MLKACDACADTGQLQHTVPIRKTFLKTLLARYLPIVVGGGWLTVNDGGGGGGNTVNGILGT